MNVSRRPAFVNRIWTRLTHLLGDGPRHELRSDEYITSIVEALRAAKSVNWAWLAWRAQPSKATLAEVDQRMRELRGRLDAIRMSADVVGRDSIPAGGE